MTDIGWTDARLDALKTLWKGGLSAAEIAAQLGGGLTSNAVLGKVHRLKLEKRVNNWHDKKSGRASAPKRPVRQTSSGLVKSVPTLAHPEPVVPVPELVEPSGRGVSIHALDKLFEMCRWVVSPDPTRKGRDRYCGEPTVKGCSWCAWHKSKVFTKATGPNPQPDLKKKVQHKPSMGDRSFGAVAW